MRPMLTSDSGAVTWGEALREFRDWMHSGHKSPGTTRLYCYRLAELEADAARPGDVTTKVLLRHLSSAEWKANTRKNVRSAYRTFFTWAHKAGHIDHNPAADLPTVRVGKTIPRPTPDAVLEKAFRETAPREDFMIRLGVFGGLRCHEIARVHSDDWDGYRLIVFGKGGKQRTVYVYEQQLKAHLDAVRGYAFPNRWTGLPLTAGHVSKLLSKALSETWTGHTLRHRMATVGLDGTKDVAALKEALGHAKVDTTMIYALISDERVAAVFAAAAGADPQSSSESPTSAGAVVLAVANWLQQQGVELDLPPSNAA